MRNDNRNVQQRASLTELMKAAPMTAEAHAALLRKKTALRRAIEDRRMVAQALAEPFGRPA